MRLTVSLGQDDRAVANDGNAGARRARARENVAYRAVDCRLRVSRERSLRMRSGRGGKHQRNAAPRGELRDPVHRRWRRPGIHEAFTDWVDHDVQPLERARAEDAGRPFDREAPDRPAGRLVAVVTVPARLLPPTRRQWDTPTKFSCGKPQVRQ